MRRFVLNLMVCSVFLCLVGCASSPLVFRPADMDRKSPHAVIRHEGLFGKYPYRLDEVVLSTPNTPRPETIYDAELGRRARGRKMALWGVGGLMMTELQLHVPPGPVRLNIRYRKSRDKVRRDRHPQTQFIAGTVNAVIKNGEEYCITELMPKKLMTKVEWEAFEDKKRQ